MLNPAFSKSVIEKYYDHISDYILPSELIDLVSRQNFIMDTGSEFRLQEAYTYEIWNKISSLGLNKFNWNKSKVLDVACGTGFLSYHLLKMITPLELNLIDISPKELLEARTLLQSNFNNSNINYYEGDILKMNLPENYFDMIIGNSFLHHFYDIPYSLIQFKKLLKPGGVFITLHEPTIPALAYEAGSIKLILKYVLKGSKYIDTVRYCDGLISPGGGADVWIFDYKDVRDLFLKANFQYINIKNWHILRPYIVARFSLHLNNKHPYLNCLEKIIFKSSIFIDGILNKFLPYNFFGSISLAAYKSKND